MHADVKTVLGRAGLTAHTRQPYLDNEQLKWEELPEKSTNTNVVRQVSEPFAATGGLRLLQGNLGRAIIKASAVPPDAWTIRAPAKVFDSQDSLVKAFKAGQLDQDFVAVVIFQGPQANGMPELHHFTPVLGSLMSAGYKVALVTDGRMSGASGKVPAALHISPEAAQGGPLARVQDGDIIELDVNAGVLKVLVAEQEFAARVPRTLRPANEDHTVDFGRELFVNQRRFVTAPEHGASTLFSES
jgi:phosphogluconate dehydratase